MVMKGLIQKIYQKYVLNKSGFSGNNKCNISRSLNEYHVSAISHSKAR